MLSAISLDDPYAERTLSNLPLDIHMLSAPFPPLIVLSARDTLGQLSKNLLLAQPGDSSRNGDRLAAYAANLP